MEEWDGGNGEAIVNFLGLPVLVTFKPVKFRKEIL